MIRPISKEDIVRDIDWFCKEFGMKTTEFGLKALKDGSFYRRLKEDKRSPTLERIERVYDFMEQYSADNAKGGADDLLA